MPGIGIRAAQDFAAPAVELDIRLNSKCSFLNPARLPLLRSLAVGRESQALIENRLLIGSVGLMSQAD
jgi:hypothetical protein